MPFRLPNWASDVAIVGAIFAVGGYVARLEYGIAEMQEEIRDLDKKIVSIETAVSIHHGSDWTEKLQDKTLSKVDDLENTITRVGSDLDKKMKSIGDHFESKVNELSDLEKTAGAMKLWAKQADRLVENSRLERFRSIALFTTRNVDDPLEVYINKQHHKGRNFKKGDPVLLINPLPPGLQEEVVVAGFLDDPTKPKVLVQINERLVEKLGLDRKAGEFELFVQPNPKALRWKTFDDFYIEVGDLGLAGH